MNIRSSDHPSQCDNSCHDPSRPSWSLAPYFALIVATAAAQMPAGYNADESAIKPYTLLDPLTFSSGQPVRTPADWPRRRAELLQLFEENVYGHTPAAANHIPLRAHIDEVDTHALGGKAIRKQITLSSLPSSKLAPRNTSSSTSPRTITAAPQLTTTSLA